MYKLTCQAADDFAEIYDYTLLKFGEFQADNYTEAIDNFFQTLAEMPDIGRKFHAFPSVMRIEFQQHAIFYTVRDTHILIVRILHQNMNHKYHLL